MHKKYWPKEYLCIYCFHFSELIPSHITERNFVVGFSSKFWIWISKFILDLWLSAVFCPIKNIRNHSTISRSGSPAPIPESLCNEKEPPYFTCCLAFLNRTALECLKWVKKHKLCQICLRQRLFEQTSEEWTYGSTAFFHTPRLASRMDQIFGNRCLTWRVLRTYQDTTKMTVKRFSVSSSCTANRLKVPHRMTDNMAKQTKTTSGIVFPFTDVMSGGGVP